MKQVHDVNVLLWSNETTGSMIMTGANELGRLLNYNFKLGTEIGEKSLSQGPKTAYTIQ